MRKQKDPQGKYARWIMELEEYDYSINYVPGIENVKADPLSQNKSAKLDQPISQLEEKIYAISKDATFALSNNGHFLEQIQHKQDMDPVISIVKRADNQW